MPNIQAFEKNNYKPIKSVIVKGDELLPQYRRITKQGEGIGDLFKTIGSTIMNNKNLIIKGASAVGNLASAGKSIADATKTANELKQLQEMRNIALDKLKKESKQKKEKNFPKMLRT